MVPFVAPLPPLPSTPWSTPDEEDVLFEEPLFVVSFVGAFSFKVPVWGFGFTRECFDGFDELLPGVFVEEAGFEGYEFPLELPECLFDVSLDLALSLPSVEGFSFIF